MVTEQSKSEHQESYWLMKTVKTKKKFDAVEMMRDIRDKIDKDIQGMTFEEEKEYFRKGAEKYKKEERSGR